MIQVNKEVHLLRVTSSSGYVLTNIKWLHKDRDKIGAAIGAVNYMISRDVEFKQYLRKIIGLSPDSSNWDTKVFEYWNNIAENISDTGKVLQIGHKYSIDGITNGIAKSIIESKEIKTDAELVEFVYSTNKQGELNVLEEERYMYGTAIAPADYILWRYCLVYSNVANREEDINKAPKKIRFYLHDPQEAKLIAKNKFQESMKATQKLMTMSTDDSKITYMLKAMDFKGVDLLDPLERLQLLKGVVDSNPSRFFEVEADKELQLKALIFDALNKNLIRKLPNTEIIVNSDNESLGNNLLEVVAHLKDVKNKAFLNSLEAQLKSLPKTNKQ
jgi:hypothetical protein